MDGTDEKKYQYKITEVAEMLHETSSTLRFWESKFDFYVKPQTNGHGTRKYKEEDIEKLKRIQYLLRERKLTIEGAKAYLKDNKGERVIENSEVVERLKEIKAELLDIKNTMLQMYPADTEADDDECFD